MWQEYFGKDLVTIYGIDVNPYCKVSGADLALRQSPERTGSRPYDAGALEQSLHPSGGRKFDGGI